MSNDSTVRIAAALRDLLAQVELTELPNINIPLFRGDPQHEPFPSRVLLTQAYPDVAALLHGLAQHNPQAIEATLQVLTPIAPEAAEDVAIDALANGWPSLRVTATRVLGRLDTAARFHALFNAAFVDDPEQRFADHLRASLEAGAFPGLLQRDGEPDPLLAALIATHKPL